MIVYVAIEYNWNRVGGIFSSKKAGEQWATYQGKVEPNLMWKIHPFEIDKPISDEEAVQDWRN